MFIDTPLFSVILYRRWLAYALTLVTPLPSISVWMFPWKLRRPSPINFLRRLSRAMHIVRSRRVPLCPRIPRDGTLCSRFSIMSKIFSSNTNKSLRTRKDPLVPFLGNRWASYSKLSNRHGRNPMSRQKARIKQKRNPHFSSAEKRSNGLLSLDITIISTKMNFTIRRNDKSLLFYSTADALLSFCLRLWILPYHSDKYESLTIIVTCGDQIYRLSLFAFSYHAQPQIFRALTMCRKKVHLNSIALRILIDQDRYLLRMLCRDHSDLRRCERSSNKVQQRLALERYQWKRLRRSEEICIHLPLVITSWHILIAFGTSPWT